MRTFNTQVFVLAFFVGAFMLMSSECSSQKNNRGDGANYFHLEQLAQLAAQNEYDLLKEACEKGKPEIKDCDRQLKEAEEKIREATLVLKRKGVNPIPTPPSPNPCMPLGNCPDFMSLLKNMRIIYPLEAKAPKIYLIDAKSGEKLAVAGKASPIKEVKGYGQANFKAENEKFLGNAKLIVILPGGQKMDFPMKVGK